MTALDSSALERASSGDPAWLKAAADVSAAIKLAEPIPKLCALVTASPFDAALSTISAG